MSISPVMGQKLIEYKGQQPKLIEYKPNAGASMGFGGSSAESTPLQTSLWSKLLSKTPASVQNAVSNTITWGKAPIADSPIYQKISNSAGSGLAKLAEKAGEVATKNAGAEGFMAKLIGKAANYIAPAAKSTEGFIGKMGGVAKSGGIFTKGNVAIAAAFEATDIIEGFKEGRGIKQTVQSATKVGTGVAGGLAAMTAAGLILGATPVGWAAAGIVLAGTAIGYMVGGKATNFLGHNQKGLFEKGQAVAINQQTPAQFGSMTAHNGTVAPIPFDFNNPGAGIPQLV